MNKIPLFRRGDSIPMLVCLALAAALFVWSISKADAARLVVRTPQGETVYSLQTPTELEVVGKDGLCLTVCIDHNSAYVLHADCEDQVCVHTGRLTRSGQSAACLPAGVVLTVRGGDTSTDAVAR